VAHPSDTPAQVNSWAVVPAGVPPHHPYRSSIADGSAVDADGELPAKVFSQFRYRLRLRERLPAGGRLGHLAAALPGPAGVVHRKLATGILDVCRAGTGPPGAESVLGNDEREQLSKVDMKDADRRPLLLIEGEKDHTVGPAMASAAYKPQWRNSGVTEFVTFLNGSRPHDRRPPAPGRSDGARPRAAVHLRFTAQ
jgi:hypothetical protein